MRQGPKTKMSFRNGFPRGFLNTSGYRSTRDCKPRLAFAAYSGEQYLDVSVEVDKNVLQERISEGMRDQIRRKHLQCYFKLWEIGCTLSCTDRVLAALSWARLKRGGFLPFKGVMATVRRWVS